MPGYYTNAALRGYGIRGAGESIKSLMRHRVRKGTAAAVRKMAYVRSMRKSGSRRKKH